jgi:hypothetical protein
MQYLLKCNVSQNEICHKKRLCFKICDSWELWQQQKGVGKNMVEQTKQIQVW